jgi:hypothetical protein
MHIHVVPDYLEYLKLLVLFSGIIKNPMEMIQYHQTYTNFSERGRKCGII